MTAGDGPGGGLHFQREATWARDLLVRGWEHQRLEGRYDGDDPFRRLRVDEPVADISSTDVRRRITEGFPWRHLVPDPIQDSVAELYTEIGR